MNKSLPIVYLVGHGETAWNVTGQHVGNRDLPLIERGERNALRLKERLRGLQLASVCSGPLQRVAKTCELAGFGAVAQITEDLREWDFGLYEGRSTADILKERPGWDLFRDGCPGGESPAQVAARAERIVQSLRAVEGQALVFSSVYLLRMLAAAWLAPGSQVFGSRLFLSAASLSALSYENSCSCPVIRFWNDVHHVGG